MGAKVTKRTDGKWNIGRKVVKTRAAGRSVKASKKVK